MPPFFIPILAFVFWLAALASFYPVLKLDLYLSDQFVAALFFVSNLILVISWPLSGPVIAAILSVLTVGVSLYMALAVKEPSFFLQLFACGGLFLSMAVYLQKIQVKVKSRLIAREKVTEDLTVAQKEIAGKTALSISLRKKIDQFLGLQHFSENLKEVSAIGSAAAKIVNEGMRVLVNADECVLYLVDETRQELYLAAASRKPELGSGGEPFPTGSAFDQWALKSSQGIVVEDTLNDYRFSADAAQSPAGLMRCVLATPLIVENRVLGVVRANCDRPNSFNADDLRLLDIFSSMGAVTLRNLLLYRKMDELATHDSVTGLYVNRHFQSCLSAEIDKGAYGRIPFSVLLLDIDFFKSYNDEFGHSAGDLVLKTIAGIIASCLGPGEIAARYGGEEFAVILPGKTMAEGVEAAEKIRAAIQAHVFTIRRTERCVTASIGVAAFPAAGRTRDELVWAADKNLYEAKKMGRNRVCGATSS